MEYSKTLNIGEYRSIFELSTVFKGDLATKLAALKVAEKISRASSEGVTDNDKGEKVLPSEVTVSFTRNELEGYWKGIVGYVSEESTKVDAVLIAKSISTVLGFSKRFAKLEESLSIPEDITPLD
jgi:hypothetical protein